MDLGLLDLDQIQPPHVVDDGQYKLEIIKEPEKVQSKKDDDRYMVRIYLKVVDDPDAELIMENLCLIKADDKPDTAKMFGRGMKSFCQAFNIPFQGNNAQFEGSKGMTGWGMVKKEFNSEFNKDQNTVTRYILPK